MAEDRDPKAPHGRDDNGVPLTPFGVKLDGSPRLDGRGRSAGVKAPAKKRAAPRGKKARTDEETKANLVSLVDAVTMPLVGLSKSGFLARRIGEQQTMALAGDAVILDAYAPAGADVFMMFAETRPGLLSWIETLEEKAPVIAALTLGAQVAKALMSNHLKPDERLAKSGLLMAQIKSAQMADALERQARAMGIDVESTVPQAA